MISPIFDSDALKVLSLFSISPGSSFRRWEIRDKVKLNNVTLDKSLAKLLASKIIKKTKGIYSVNFENDDGKKIINILSKQYKELKELPFNIYLLLLDMVEKFSLIKSAELYLFGSYSKLIYTEKSDVDFAVLSDKAINKKSIEKAVVKLEKVYGKSVEPHYFAKKDFYSNKKDPLVKEILRNGIGLI